MIPNDLITPQIQRVRDSFSSEDAAGRKYPIREIFRRFYPLYLQTHPTPPFHVQRVANAIMRCKTGELGYNVSFCDDCGYSLTHTVSCNNRYCPCCQSALIKKWELERTSELITGISYYHVVFTLPEEINHLMLANQKLLFDLFFRCVKDTLIELCADPKFMGAKPSVFGVLHTWGQKLNFHPHIHLCVSGGGITPANTFVETRHKGFFIPEKVLASSLRGRFITELKQFYDAGKLDFSYTPNLGKAEHWKSFVNTLFSKAWLPFVKETFNGNGNAVKYLARYSFRSAIANSRIVSFDDSKVTFSYKDYTDNCKQKQMTVKGTEFIRLFLQHVLPKHFNRMRSFGLLTNCRKKKNLHLVHKLRNTVYRGNPYQSMNNSQLLKVLYKKDICSCEKCGGRMRFFPRGQPEHMLPLLPKRTFLATS